MYLQIKKVRYCYDVYWVQYERPFYNRYLNNSRKKKYGRN